MLFEKKEKRKGIKEAASVCTLKVISPNFNTVSKYIVSVRGK